MLIKFQVGTVKNTRFITVTSTLEKTLQPVESTLPVLPNKITEPLTENILATTPVGKIKKPDRIDYLKKKIEYS